MWNVGISEEQCALQGRDSEVDAGTMNNNACPCQHIVKHRRTLSKTLGNVVYAVIFPDNDKAREAHVSWLMFNSCGELQFSSCAPNLIGFPQNLTRAPHHDVRLEVA